MESQSNGGPREVAHEYLRKHKIDEIFEELGSSLLFHRPEDVNEHLLKTLVQMKEKKDEQQHSSLFNDEDLKTLFNMYDSEKNDYIDKERCLEALKVIGVKENCEDLLPEDDVLTRDVFLMITKNALRKVHIEHREEEKK